MLLRYGSSTQANGTHVRDPLLIHLSNKWIVLKTLHCSDLSIESHVATKVPAHIPKLVSKGLPKKDCACSHIYTMTSIESFECITSVE